MKKLYIFCAAAAALLMTASCEELANMITTNPTFSVTDSVYDGQEQQLQKLGTCEYEWVIPEEYKNNVSITLNSDKKAFAKFQLTYPYSDYKKVSIYAYNANDESIDPYIGETTIRPWKLQVFVKDASGKWVVATGGVPEQFNVSLVSGQSNFRIQMVALQNDKSWKEVSTISYTLKENGSLTWTIPSGVTVVKKAETYVEFTYPGSGTFTFGAALGARDHTASVFKN